MNIILLLDENKSSGPSRLPVKLIKIALPVIIIPLCKLINHSFDTGIFLIQSRLARLFSIRISKTKFTMHSLIEIIEMNIILY